VAGERVEVRAPGADVRELGLLVGLEMVWPGQEQARDLAGLGCRGRRLGRGVRLPERRDVAADGLRAAGPAALAQLGVERRGVADASFHRWQRCGLNSSIFASLVTALTSSSSMLWARARRCTVLRSRPVARLIAEIDWFPSSRARMSA
jgi:hypothetical protein